MNINHIKRFWPTLAVDDGSGQVDSGAPADNSSMQILVDGTAQALCERLWKGYVANDMTQFPNFMQQIDEICNNYVQSMPVPVDPANLEDGDIPTGAENLPSIGAQDDSDNDDD